VVASERDEWLRKIAFYLGRQDVTSPENYSSDIYVMTLNPE
jgi:hypothetical protein